MPRNTLLKKYVNIVIINIGPTNEMKSFCYKLNDMSAQYIRTLEMVIESFPIIT